MIKPNTKIPTTVSTNLHLIHERCQDFIRESDGNPLLKNLPVDYNDFHKVKVRKRKQYKAGGELFSVTFNEAFDVKGLRERSVFANGLASLPTSPKNQEAFYLFPIDGFQYMYSKEVENSTQDYRDVFDAIFSEFGLDRGKNIVLDLLKFTYNSNDLAAGIEEGAEIIMYNLPYFYAIKKSVIPSYPALLDNVHSMRTITWP